MDVRDRRRLAMTRRVLSQLRNIDFRTYLREYAESDLLPIIVVLPDDPLEYFFDRLEELESVQAVVVVAADERSWSTLSVEPARPAGISRADLQLRPGSTMDMLISYVRMQRGRSIRCSLVRDELTVELLHDSGDLVLG